MDLKKKKRYSYIRKKLSIGTWQSIATVAVAFVLLVFCLGLAVWQQGEGPMVIGALGLSSFFAALLSISSTAGALRDKGSNMLPAKLAGSIALVLVLLWIALIFLGIRLLLVPVG